MPDDPVEESITLEKNEELDAIGHAFGQMLANSLKDQSIRKFIKTEVTQKFDGDYDFLFLASKDKEVPGLENGRGEPMSFGEAIFNTQNENGRTSESDFDDLIEQIETQYPTMQVSIPQLEEMTADDWDEQSELPLVAILESDFRNGVTEYIEAYDTDGNIHQLDADKEPEQLVIVISRSERVEAIANTYFNSRTEDVGTEVFGECLQGAEYIYQNENFTLITVDDLFGCGSGGGSGGGDWGYGEGSFCRTYGKKEILHRIKLNSLSKFESWAQGSPEIVLRVYAPKYNYHMVNQHEFEPSLRKYIDNKWWPTNHDEGFLVFTWNYEEYGEHVQFLWTERDSPWFDIGINPQKIMISSTYTETNGEIIRGEKEVAIGKNDYVMGSHSYVVDIQDFCKGGEVLHTDPVIDWYERIK